MASSTAEAGPLQFDSPVVDVSTGVGHTCVILENAELYCFGDNINGELGYGHVDDIGDDELPTDAGPVPLF